MSEIELNTDAMRVTWPLAQLPGHASHLDSSGNIRPYANVSLIFEFRYFGMCIDFQPSSICFPDVQCGMPARIPNGGYKMVNDTRHYLSMTSYTCNDGYQLIGRGDLICDIDGRWNGPPPRCERK